jgi:hypothetical protein
MLGFVADHETRAGPCWALTRLALAAGLGLLALACRTPPSQPPRAGLDADPPAAPDPDTDPTPLAHADDDPALTREEIRTVVRAKLPEIRACFELGSEPEPAPHDPGPARARIKLRFAIDPSGRAQAVVVEASDLADPAAAACLVEQLRRWQFPRPRGGRPLEVRYPFVYSSEAALRAAGLPRVEGTVDPLAIAAVFEARRSELDPCVPDHAHGSLGVALRLDDGGRVTRISSYLDTLPEGASACLLRTLSRWSFPPAASGDEAQVNHDLRW